MSTPHYFIARAGSALLFTSLEAAKAEAEFKAISEPGVDFLILEQVGIATSSVTAKTTWLSQKCSDTPRTNEARFDLTDDGVMVPYDDGDWVNVLFARQLERELAEAKAECRKLNEACNGWMRDATDRSVQIKTLKSQIACIYSPESSVWIWQGDGSDHPESMVNSLPVVMTASTLREKQADVRSLCEQLTAHKAALEKCEKALNNFIPNNHSISDASRQIALAAIKQLKQQ